MRQPTAKTSAAQRFLTFLTKMVIKVSKTITIVTVLGKRSQYPVLMNEKYKSGFGEAVRMQRAVCNLTKERLSLMVGINRLTLRRIESGDANPTLDVMYRISEGLGVPLSELIAQAEEAETGLPAKPTNATGEFPRPSYGARRTAKTPSRFARSSANTANWKSRPPPASQSARDVSRETSRRARQ